MKALRNVLTKLLNVLAGVSFIAMVVLTCWQVFTRYVLQLSLIHILCLSPFLRWAL